MIGLPPHITAREWVCSNLKAKLEWISHLCKGNYKSVCDGT